MSGPNQKRSRKTKLVPRSFKDCDDSDNLQEAPRKKVSKVNSNFNSIHDEPTTSTYQPLQFDIKVEVEECDDEELFDTTTDFISETEIKTEILNENDLFEVEERDINSLLAQALSKKKGQFTKESDDENVGNTLALENDHDYSPRDKNKKNHSRKQPNSQSQNPTSICHLQLDEDAILNSLNELCKGGMSLADKILGIEMRNLWGRCRTYDYNPSIPEKKIQIALNTWKYWKVSFRGGEVPLMYKCYMCEKAWWHLGPFQEHLSIHTEEMRIESESQAQTAQYNIVAYSLKSNQVFKDFIIDSNCWRCGYGYEHHIQNEKLFLCEFCFQTFQTCLKHRAHEAECVKKLKSLVKTGPIVIFTCHICNLKLLFKDILTQHYLEYHNVRSDLPMIVDVRTCMTCSKNYLSLPFHYCNKKNYSIMCNYCAKRFPSKIALEIHLQEQSNYWCVVCGYVLAKKCMLAEHMLKHTKKFVMLHKCLSCKDNVLLFDEDSVKQHKIIWHKQKVDKRRNYFEMVLVPRKFIEAHKLEEHDLSSAMSGPSEKQIVEQKDNDSPLVKVKIKVDTEIETDTIDLDDNNPSLNIKIKQEKKEFNDFNDSIVKEKMIEGMHNNNSFTEDDEGYEYILSSVFNAANSTNLDREIAEEADDFEELINEELKKSKERQPRQKKTFTTTARSPETVKTITTDENELKIAISKIEEVEPKTVIEEPEQTKCDYQDCDFIATDKQNLCSHKTHKVVIINCSKCGKSFCTIKGYLCHLVHHGYPQWSCPDCLRTYASYSSLTAHIRVTANRSFCKTQFVDKSRGKLAVTFQCKRCKVVVPRQSILDHWETHLGIGEASIVKVEIEEEDGEVDVGGEIEYDQPGEPVTDLTEEVMEKVIEALVARNKRGRTREDKTCIACGRVFERRNDCKRHHIEHLLANAYGTKMMYKGLRCQICQIIYDRADGYKQHMRDHGHLPLYKCHLCFKTFSDSSNYVKHKKTHSSLYICDICKKKFQAKGSLIKHMQCHTTIEPIKCIFCPKQYFTESDFSRHVRNAHNQGLFKYSCIICKKKFKSLKDKWNHMWIEHKERKVKADCPVCSAEFRKLSDVKKHLKGDHNMDMSVFNVKVLKQLLQKMKEGKDVGDEDQLITVKSEPDDDETQYAVVKSEDSKKKLQIYNKNDVLIFMNNELLKKSPNK